MKTQTIAAIDIGSNSLKLVIVKASAIDSFTVVLQERERVRLGHETLRTGRLSAEAINLSAEAIGRFRQTAENRGADVILAVATASVRSAENAAEFVSEIEKRTGVRVEILSSLEEARLIGIAAAQNVCANECTLLNVDIGGGSTELSQMKAGEPHKLFSMKIGAVGLTEKFIFSDPPKPKELKNLRFEIEQRLEKPFQKLKNEKWDIATGTSGTILNLASLINSGDKENFTISLNKLGELNQNLTAKTIEQRAELPSISRQRAEVIVAGGQILEAVMRALKIEILQPCAFALREGVIIDRLRQTEAESLPPVPDTEDKRLRDVFAVGRHFNYEETHALQLAHLAEEIFDELAPVYRLERHWRTLLSAAALLHEIGYHISHEDYHKHTLYLIKHSPITGFSETEKLIVANVARYHKGSMPKDKHLDFISLGEKDRSVVARLAGILRLADALDRAYRHKIQKIKFKRADDTLYLKISGDVISETESEIIDAKKDLFETAFGDRLIVEAGLSKN